MKEIRAFHTLINTKVYGCDVAIYLRNQASTTIHEKLYSTGFYGWKVFWEYFLIIKNPAHKKRVPGLVSRGYREITGGRIPMTGCR